MAGTAPSSTMQRLEEDFHIVRRTDGFATASRQTQFNDPAVNLASRFPESFFTAPRFSLSKRICMVEGWRRNIMAESNEGLNSYRNCESRPYPDPPMQFLLGWCTIIPYQNTITDLKRKLHRSR